MINGIWRGHYSPTILYWVFGTLYTIVAFRGVNPAILTAYLKSDAEWWIDPALTALFLFSALVYGILARAIYISMYSDRSPSVFTWMGIGLLVFGVVRCFMFITQILVPGVISYGPTQMEQEAAFLRSSAPIDLGDGWTLMGADFSNGVFSVDYRIRQNANGLQPSDMMTAGEIRDTCIEFRDMFNGAMREVRYVYRYRDGPIEVSLNRDTCAVHLQ
ncbi:MAG: hypothetical protein ACPG5U_07250 [Planktomarina sp.]